MAKLYFRHGAMNSGKSTALLQVAHNYEERGQAVILAKPNTDSKGEDAIVSRLGVERSVDLLVSPNENLRVEFTLLANEHRARSNTEQEAVADLASSAGDGNTYGSSHGRKRRPQMPEKRKPSDRRVRSWAPRLRQGSCWRRTSELRRCCRR